MFHFEEHGFSAAWTGEVKPLLMQRHGFTWPTGTDKGE